MREFMRPIWGWAAGGYCAVATYDGVSSQLNLPTISSIWGSSRQLLPLWGWIAIAQTIALAWIYKVALERTSSLRGIVPSNEIASLSKRLKTSQDHIQQILAWHDKVGEQVSTIPLLAKQVDSNAYNISALKTNLESIGDDIVSLNKLGGINQINLAELVNIVGGQGERLSATIRVAMPIDVGAVLENVASRMDQISAEAYCGAFDKAIDTDVEPNTSAMFTFDALAKVACDLVTVVPGLHELIDIPNGHGRSLFIPIDEGYLVQQEQDEIKRERGYAAVQRRYIHFQIREFLRCGRGQ